jgi:hypothetical protein
VTSALQNCLQRGYPHASIRGSKKHTALRSWHLLGISFPRLLCCPPCGCCMASSLPHTSEATGQRGRGHLFFL